MSEWKGTTLGDLVRGKQAYLQTGPFGTALKADEYQKEGVPLISVREIKAGRIVIDDNTPRLGENTIKRLSRYLLHEGDIVFGRKGAIERSGLISKSQDGFFLGSDGICLRLTGNIDAAFVAYQIRSKRIATWLMANAGGTTMPSMNQSILDRLPLSLPPLPTQRKIAAVLSSLDDKIENNRKICANLEAQAQAIYKSWFVDFEPFGGKMPQGWKMGKLGDVGNIVGGATPSKAKAEFYTEEGIAWLTPKDLSLQQTKFVAKGDIDITEEGYKSASVRMLPKGSVLFSSRAPIGYVAIAKNELCTNQGFKSVVPFDWVGSEFVYQLLRMMTPVIEERASGSTFKEISSSGMKELPVIVPSENVLHEFSSITLPMGESQKSLEEESRALAAMRDALLPKLMSGEIDVEKVEVV